MALLEEVMAGLFGGNEARGAQGVGGAELADDPRRRRAGRPSGFDSIAGGAVSLMDIMPHLQGLRSYDYSGPNIRGLRDLLPAMEGIMGPSRRHLEQQLTPDFDLPPGLADRPMLPPGIDSRNAIAGPNVAPGNVDTGLALGQAPGIPAHATAAMRDMPHTQGWRNVAPGYSAAAAFGYGTPEFEQRIQGFGPGGRPSAIAGGPEAVKPGFGGGVSAGGGGQAKAAGGGGTPLKAGGPAQAAPSAGGGLGKPGAASAGAGAPAGPKQPSTKQVAAKKSSGADIGGKKGGTGAATGTFKDANVGGRFGGGPAPAPSGGPDAGGKKGGPSQKEIVAKKGGAKKTTVGDVVGSATQQVGQQVANVVSGPAPKPAPKPAPTGAPKSSTTPLAGPGKTKPKTKTTTAAGTLKSK